MKEAPEERNTGLCKYIKMNLNVSMNLRFYDDHRIKIVEVHLEEYVFKKTHLRVNICVHLANVNLEAFAPEFIHLI